MNRNGHGPVVDYWIKVLSEPDPDTRSTQRMSLAAKRKEKVLNSLLTRPFYQPLTFTMNAAGQVQPYNQLMPDLGYDVVITGARCDAWLAGPPVSGRDIVIQFTNNNESQQIVRTGGDTTLYLTTDDFAGSTIDSGGGQLGVFQFTNPIFLEKGNRISVDMYKTDTTADPETVNLVFIGFRVYKKQAAETVITPQELALIDRYINGRETPEMRFLKLTANFPAAAVGSEIVNLQTVKLAEPVILRGLRTTLRNCTLQIGINGEPEWMPEQTPIWAVMAENDMQVDNYLWFEKGVYLPSMTPINITRMINGNIDQANVDPTTGEITIIYDTV